MNFRVSAAGPSYCAVLAKLHGLCFAESWPEMAFADVLAMPGAFALLVGQEQAAEPAPMGFALARVAGGKCEIITLGVLPEHRGRGAGSCLLRAVTSRAGALGAESLLLEVADDNPSAIALYRSAAFRPVGRCGNYYRRAGGPPVDAIVMRRPLLS